MSSEFVTTVPDIFNEYELEDLVYIETRKAPGSLHCLSGNLDTSTATLNEIAYTRAASTEPFPSWQQQEMIAAKRRLRTLKDLSGLALITSPNLAPTSLNENEGHLHLYADEAPIVIFTPGGEAIIHLKIDYLSLASESLYKVLHKYEKLGHDASSAGVYIGPHAHTLPLTPSEFDEMNKAVSTASPDVKQSYRMFTKMNASGHPVLDFTSMLFHQLERAGIRPGDIEVSNYDTRGKDSPYFSRHRSEADGTVAGRFGVLIGKRPTR